MKSSRVLFLKRIEGILGGVLFLNKFEEILRCSGVFVFGRIWRNFGVTSVFCVWKNLEESWGPLALCFILNKAWDSLVYCFWENLNEYRVALVFYFKKNSKECILDFYWVWFLEKLENILEFSSVLFLEDPKEILGSLGILFLEEF